MQPIKHGDIHQAHLAVHDEHPPRRFNALQVLVGKRDDGFKVYETLRVIEKVPNGEREIHHARWVAQNQAPHATLRIIECRDPLHPPTIQAPHPRGWGTIYS